MNWSIVNRTLIVLNIIAAGYMAVVGEYGVMGINIAALALLTYVEANP